MKSLSHLAAVNGKRPTECPKHGPQQNWCARCKMLLCPICTNYTDGYTDVSTSLSNPDEIRRLCRDCCRIWREASKAFFEGKSWVITDSHESGKR